MIQLTHTSMMLHRIHDQVVNTAGLLCNVLLVFVALKRTQPNFRNFANLVLLSAAIDILYSSLQLLCQHQHEVINGQFFFMASGIERVVSERASYFISTVQMTVALMSVTILPVQFYYRFLLVNSSYPPSIWLLFGLTLGSIGVSFTMGILGTLAHIESAKRGRDYYVNQISDVWNDEDGKSKFISAIDLKDSISLLYYGFGSNVIALSYGISLFFGYKSVMFVQPLHGLEVSERTKALRAQFTRNLIIQAICGYCSSVVPTGFVALISVLHIDASGYFVWFASVISWGPFLDALIPLILIKPYRSYVASVFGLGPADSHSGLSQDGRSMITTTKVKTVTVASA
ncbi:hypothetical protein M3Y94_00068300 [Aphelenchoides besseyi]|nr:hypothetical protein M3Y94_00068300 [Aphelenchoides besseyi]KAI6237894.1 hypothetical protein M3Y95_00312700 [Aphelenchoides besseyi]